MHEELLFFCRAFWAGACLAAGYDLLRIFRRLVSHSPFLTGAEDILYWCCAGIYLFGMIYRENDGVIRTYALLAVFLGGFVFHAGLGSVLVTWLPKVLRKIFHFLGVLINPLRKWRKRLKFLWDRVKISLYEAKVMQKIRKWKNEKKKKKNEPERNRDA